MDVGLQQVRGQQLGVDFQGALDGGLGHPQLEFIERQLAKRHLHFGRVGIDRQRRLEGLRGFGLIVLLGEQPARLVLRLPARRVERQQVGIELVDEKTKLVALAIPAGRFGCRQANAMQVVRILDVLLVELLDQCLVVGFGFGQFAGGRVQLGADPAGQHVAGLEYERRRRQLRRGRRITPLESQPGQLGRQGAAPGCCSAAAVSVATALSPWPVASWQRAMPMAAATGSSVARAS